MRKLLLLSLLAPALVLAQTNPGTFTWTKAASPSGYFTATIGQFDKALWIPTRGCYALWGQYKSATFSEENDAMGCWSYAENRWHLLVQSSSIHGVSHPQTGHQWGQTFYVPSTDQMFWVSNSGAQGLEEDFTQWIYDMAGITVYRSPLWSIGGVLSRPWISGAGTLSGYTDYDSTHGVAIYFPDTNNATGHATVCTVATGVCVASATTNGPAAVQATSSLRFDPDDGNTYWFGGGGTTVFKINGGSPASGWTNMSSATCSGADCTSGHPPARSAFGWAYSTVDHVFLMVSGLVGATQQIDTWKFDPSGNGSWTELCGPGTTSCGTPVGGASFPSFTTAREGDRLVYDSADNVFIVSDDGGTVWVYAISAPLSFSRTAPSYAPTVGVSPVVGPLNRTLPPTTPSSSNAQTQAFDLSVDASGSTLYISHVEPTIASDLSVANVPVPYIWSSTASGNWLPTGTQLAAATAIGNGTNIQPAGHPFHANVAGVEWEAHDKRNWSGFSSNGQLSAQVYNSGSGTWGAVVAAGISGTSTTTVLLQNINTKTFTTQSALAFTSGIRIRATSAAAGDYMEGVVTSYSGTTLVMVADTASGGFANHADWSFSLATTTGCFSATCFSSGSTIPQSWSQGLVNANGTPALLEFETLSTFAQSVDVFVAKWSGTSWVSTTGTTPLNITAGSYASFGALASDPSGNMLPCWTEETNSGRQTMSLTPQLRCKYYNGSTWSVTGGGSLNQSASAWAMSPSVTFAGTAFYVAYTEQSQTGLPRLFVYTCTGGGSCSLMGGAVNNNTSTGLAFHPSIVHDGTTILVGWGEQSAIGQHSLLYIKRWTGSAWVPVVAGVAADPTNGSVAEVNLAVTTAGSVTAVWTEKSWGNLRQIYYASYPINAPTLSVPITVQELLCSGCSAGIARTNEPITVGIPLPDSAGITSTSVLALSTATAGQFSVEGLWPSGNIKWVKVRAIIPTLSAGGTTTMSLSNGGSGNFGGANLATDNGTTITVSTNGGSCGSGAAICFTIKKAHFNFLDIVQNGTTTMVATGTSAGLVVLGPNPTATFPGNVTCLPTSGGTNCSNVFSTANDASSTAVIEENGPAMTVIKATADLNDGSGHVYMHTVTRMYFSQGKATVRATVSLRNADLGTSGTFASATKGHQGFELRLVPNLTGTLTYTIANHTGSPTTGTLNSGGGTDYAYIYQASSNNLKQTNQCTSPCVSPSSISGYSIINNGTAALTGNANQWPVGWASIADAGGHTIVIGQEQFSGYGNESLEFRGGGLDLRIGMWAEENNTTSTSTLTPNQPYYTAWPQINLKNIWLDFEASAPASPQNDFLRFQYQLAGRADYSWYNGAGVFPYPMLSAAEEDAYYNSAFTTASPSVTTRTPSDLPIGNTGNADILCSTTVCIFYYYNWASTGGANQMEFRLAHLFDFIRRGYTGGYLQSSYFYKYAAEWAYPTADGYTWATQGATQYYDYPTATSTNSSLASGLWNVAHGTYLENDSEHSNNQGQAYYYWMSGDEFIREATVSYSQMYLNSASSSNYTTLSPAIWNDRSVGNVFFAIYALYDFLTSTGDATNAATIKTRAETVYSVRLHPALCAYPGFPSGCTPDVNDNIPQVGTSLERGVTNMFKDTSFTAGAQCNGIIQNGPRTAVSFMNSRKLEGMYLLHQMETPAWASYYEEWDRAYGSALWALSTTEMFHDNGTTSWAGNGFRYKQAFDYPNACADTGNVVTDNYSVGNDQTIWLNLAVKWLYEGGTPSASEQRNLVQLLQFGSGVGAFDEFFHFTVGAAIYPVLHPPALSLSVTPITAFVDNGGGSYTISWTVPQGASSYRIKWSPKTIVQMIGFNAATYAFIGSPSTQANWFAATDASAIPSPATPGTTQSITIATGTTGLTSPNFQIRTLGNPLATAGVSAFSGGLLKYGGAVVIH